uniref:Putative pro-pol polyprotein n=1 Tax=Lutzomyia longipalpis TaxID=7200 RepID=A0A1B0CDY7_LUTLO
MVATGTPRANGLAERCFRIVGEALRSMSENESGSDWLKNLPVVQWNINSSRNRTTGHSPQELLLGFRPRNALGNVLANAIMDDIPREDINLAEIRDSAKERIHQIETRRVENHNETHKAPHKYEVGDLVLLRWEAPPTGSSRKMLPRYRGPYVVNQNLKNDRYEVTDTPTTQITSRPFKAIYPADRMKPFCSRFDIEQLLFGECQENTDDDDEKS